MREKIKRNLITERNIKKICSYTKKSFYELYGDKYYIYQTKNKTKYVNYLINFIKDNDSKYIKKYLPRIGIYFFFLALTITFIFLWLSFCIYSCCCLCCNDNEINNENNNVSDTKKKKNNDNEGTRINNSNNQNNLNNNNESLKNDNEGNENNTSSNNNVGNENNTSSINNEGIGNNTLNNNNNEGNENNTLNNNNEGNGNKTPLFKLILIITLSMNTIIIICLIILLSIGNNFKKGSNSTTCSILNIFSNIKDGEKIYDEIPKWEGIEKIKSLFNTLSNKITEISNYYQDINSTYNNVIQVEFYTKINNTTFISDKQIKNIEDYYILNPDIREDSNKNIIVDYIYNYNNSLYLTFNDYNISLYPKEQIVLNLIYILSNIRNYSNLIKENIDESNKHLDDVMSTFNVFSDKIIEEIVKYQIKINNNYKKIYYPLFSIFLIFPILNSIGFFLVYQNHPCMRILLHIVFHFQNFFTSIICLIGIFLGIISVMGKDIINVFNYSISTDNLINENPIIIKGNGREYINTCFNLNGHLSEVIGLNKDSKVNFLNELYLLDDTIKNNISLIESLTLDTQNLYNEYKNNFFDITNVNYYNNDKIKYIKNILNDLRKFTDASFDENYILENNTNKTYHMWVFNKSRCENDYLYSTNYEKSENLNEKMCFVFSDFENYPDYYKGLYCDYSKSNFQQCSIAFEFYFERLKNYTVQNKDHLEKKIIPEYEEYYVGLNDIKNNISNSLKESQKVTNILTDIFSQYLNSYNNLFDLLNCKFINRDFNIFYHELDKNVNKTLFHFSIIILIISCSSMISFLFFFIFIMKKKKNKCDDNKTLCNFPINKKYIIYASLQNNIK